MYPIKIKDYIYQQPAIATGSFSDVFYGQHIMTNEKVAIKRICIQAFKQVPEERIIKEIELIRSLNHQTVLRFIDVFKDRKNIYIITEYCNGGDLRKIINEKLSEEDIRIYMIQIKNGLKYLHDQKIVHRDLKPQNILIHYERKDQYNLVDHQDVKVKLADFGFAKRYDTSIERGTTFGGDALGRGIVRTEEGDADFKEDVKDRNEDMFQTLCGTPMYMSPEIITDKKYSLVSDLWSVGIIFYQLLFQRFPFGKAGNLLELARNIDALKLNIPDTIGRGEHQTKISNEARNLLLSLLEKDPSKRITWEQFFIHPWFSTSSIDDEGSLCIQLKQAMQRNALKEQKIQDELISENAETRVKINMSPPNVSDLDKSEVAAGVKIIDDFYKMHSNSLPLISSYITDIDLPKSTPITIPSKLKNKESPLFHASMSIVNGISNFALPPIYRSVENVLKFVGSKTV